MRSRCARARRSPARGVANGSAFFCLVLTFCLSAASTGCSSSEDALLRGDRYWADSNYGSALAEYRLAARQGGRVEADLRVAHAYVRTGQLDRARARYDGLVREDPSYADQAIFDYVWLARSSLERGDRYGAARAAEAALQLRPGLAMPDLAPTLARHYATIGDTDRALEFYHRALSGGDLNGRGALLYEIASLTERGGRCEQALPYFRAFAEQSSDHDSVTEARWRMGTCGLERGRQLNEAGEPGRALELLQTTLDLGMPPNLLDQAWFERGEALMAAGRVEDARLAFERVLELSPGGRSALVGRARRRLEEIHAGPVP